MRCGAAMVLREDDGVTRYRCTLPAGHESWHRSDRDQGAVSWGDATMDRGWANARAW